MWRPWTLIAGVAIACLPPLSSPAWSQTSGPEARELAQRLERLIARSAPPEAHVGVSIRRLGSGQVIYEREAQKLFTPASVQKIATAGAALSLLGLNRRFVTRLQTPAPLERGVLQGDVFLRGEGDPMLEPQDLSRLAAQLSAAGVKEIDGDVVGDASVFAPESRGPAGWSWDDLENGYAATVSGLSLHRNALDVLVTPGGRVGEGVRLRLMPRSTYMQVLNRATTLPAGEQGMLGIELQPGAPTAWGEILMVRGGLPAGTQEERNQLAVQEPARLATHVFREALIQQGVRVRGQAKLGTTPPGSRTLGSVESPPLADITSEMLRTSDNLLAETLLLQLGAKVRGTPGTWDKGLAELRAYLDQVGWQANSYRIADGSGLSRYNAWSPAHLARLLNHLPTQRQSYPAVLVGLPISGINGTLAQRLNQPALRGRLRAKTGTMSGVSSLAGYLEARDGQQVVLAIMTNGFVGSPSKLRELQDQIVATVADPDTPEAP
ncbi:MAG: D-alanyl-D-alanine carboxypeptidase/D-alanyl-D-alanine-endopeptidase [Candidatus Sericytochromatia bacterium]|nr:D-alanyl-D-alanine carboxypeptidase/D-alanyl-D-alanine-endopeptidase [Candidatus Sericytochromatia bacterium]